MHAPAEAVIQSKLANGRRKVLMRCRVAGEIRPRDEDSAEPVAWSKGGAEQLQARDDQLQSQSTGKGRSNTCGMRMARR
jgi:hypothetical protein